MIIIIIIIQVTEGIRITKPRKDQSARRKRNLQILGNIGSGQIFKKYLRRTKKQLKTRLYSRNLNKGINTWTVLFVRYSGPFVQWKREELKQMDQRTRRKRMKMHKALHPRDDVDRLYVSRKKGGRGLASIQDSVDASIQRLEDNIKNAEEDWWQQPQTTQTTQASTE